MANRHDVNDFLIEKIFWFRPFFDLFSSMMDQKNDRNLLTKNISFFMPVNYVKEYLMFLQTDIVFLPLKFFFKMAAIIPILRIDV